MVLPGNETAFDVALHIPAKVLDMQHAVIPLDLAQLVERPSVQVIPNATLELHAFRK